MAATCIKFEQKVFVIHIFKYPCINVFVRIVVEGQEMHLETLFNVIANRMIALKKCAWVFIADNGMARGRECRQVGEDKQKIDKVDGMRKEELL